MKKILFATLLLVASTCWAKAPNPADYRIAVHVMSSHTGQSFWGSAYGSHQQLIVLIEGKRLELESNDASSNILRTGDYKARLTKDDNSAAYEYQRTYELIFPDGETRKYQVIGESE